MRGRDRKQFKLLIVFIIAVILFCFTKYLNKAYPFYKNDNFIELFLPKNASSVDLLKEDGFENKTELLNEALQVSRMTYVSNITIKIISSENEGKMFNVEYPDSQKNFSKKNVKKDLFVEMKDIKQSTMNVFFVETSCATEKAIKGHTNNKGFVLNARQCCAVESTAFMNLNRDIYVLHSCPLSDDFLSYSPKFVERLLTYPNVHVVRVKNSELFAGTPIEELYQKGALERSSYPIEHASDAFRFTLLWKFGGTYSDLDVVTIRSFHGLKTNWAGIQDPYTIASGVLNFEPFGVGHNILQQSLDHMNKHFDGASWSSNGPILITQTLLKECNVSSVTETIKNCQTNFTALETKILYPLYYTEISKLFDEKIGKNIVKDVKSKAYSVHMWNKLSRDEKGKVGSTQAYALLADEFCPAVYRNCGDYF